tara:strand:+ start:2287 stop:2481 length:195 start_codon:yes stop_codon:yes gene_type:complete
VKVGSLVRWTNPEAPGLGVVVGKYENKSGSVMLDGHVLVRWFDGFGSGVVPEDHEYLEVVSESR